MTQTCEQINVCVNVCQKTLFPFVTGVHVCPVSAWNSTGNEIRTDDNYKAAEKKTFISYNRTRGEMKSRMLLFAFFVRSWCYDMLELMIIMRFLLTEARASTCFALLFSPSLISSRLEPPVHSPSPSLLCIQQQLSKRRLSVVAVVRFIAI